MMPEPGVRREKIDQHVGLLPLAARHLNFVEQVRPREAGDERLRLVQGEQLDDVAPHPIGGRGRQGDRRRIAQQAAEMAEPGVVGAKIVPPLADAMGLVDRQQLHPHRPNRIEKSPAAKPLGHHVEQPKLAGRHAVEPVVLLRRRERAVDEAHRQPQRMELIDLVFHQRDQRRNHQRQTVEHQCRQLVAEALSAAGGHDAKAIPPGKNRRDHLFLPGAERTEPKAGQVRLRQRRWIGHERGSCQSRIIMAHAAGANERHAGSTLCSRSHALRGNPPSATLHVRASDTERPSRGVPTRSVGTSGNVDLFPADGTADCAERRDRGGMNRLVAVGTCPLQRRNRILRQRPQTLQRCGRLHANPWFAVCRAP